jgi:hypothetical protein
MLTPHYEFGHKVKKSLFASSLRFVAKTSLQHVLMQQGESSRGVNAFEPKYCNLPTSYIHKPYTTNHRT